MVHFSCVLQHIGEATIHVRKLVFDMGGEIFTATDRWLAPNRPRDAAWLLCEVSREIALESNIKSAKFRSGDQVRATLSVERKQTVPPQRFTEAELLRYMAETGIGTEATRVDAINHLVKNQVAERVQAEPGCSRELRPTEKGMNLIERLPSSVTGITKESQLRNALDYVRSGQADFEGHLKNPAKWLAITIDGMNRASVCPS
jgi:DNA topoisomerase IA